MVICKITNFLTASKITKYKMIKLHKTTQVSWVRNIVEDGSTKNTTQKIIQDIIITLQLIDTNKHVYINNLHRL